MFSRHSVQIAALFSDVFGQALPNLCRSFYNETKAEMFFSVFAVALLAEGVDRNDGLTEEQAKDAMSPSSRRAWIEIASSQSPRSGSLRSPSSRRAYIKSSLHPAARIILFAGRSSVRRATTFFHANQRRDRVLRSRRSEHIGHLILLHDSRQIPAVAVITQQADPAKLCCKVHLLR